MGRVDSLLVNPPFIKTAVGSILRRRLFLFQVEHAFLGVDIHTELAQKIEAQEASDPRVSKDVMDGSGQIADFHAANCDRVETYKRRLDDSVGRLEGRGAAILFGVDIEFFSDRARDHRITCAGVDDKFCRGSFV